ncbi:hypothetical protein F8388_002366 [Cannabis sativa]|uniref:Uncharacterized protein n=1 Tax=Cannabis sativa TaxID=3483 RepID=A0A7J6EX84_CANSA|nr:hypothetical protein F8388_002366 [Cannabis sativa]
MGTQSQIQVLQLLQPLPLSQKRTLIFNGVRLNSIPFKPSSNLSLQNPKKRLSIILASGEDIASTSTSVSAEEATEADPEDLEYVGQIKRVLELLRKNRDMLFSPNPSTANNIAPWILTVGASTIDREFPGNVVLGDGRILIGVSLYAREPLAAFGSREKSTPFIHGAGHVDPNKALNPGLVYDLNVNDYVAFLYSIGYDSKRISIFVKAPTSTDICETTFNKVGALSSPGGLN